MLDNMTKTEFINYAREFNVFKTKQEPNYLKHKDEILNMLDKHGLTIDDIIPLPRKVNTNLLTTSVDK